MYKPNNTTEKDLYDFLRPFFKNVKNMQNDTILGLEVMKKYMDDTLFLYPPQKGMNSFDIIRGDFVLYKKSKNIDIRIEASCLKPKKSVIAAKLHTTIAGVKYIPEKTIMLVIFGDGYDLNNQIMIDLKNRFKHEIPETKELIIIRSYDEFKTYIKQIMK